MCVCVCVCVCVSPLVHMHPYNAHIGWVKNAFRILVKSNRIKLLKKTFVLNLCVSIHFWLKYKLFLRINLDRS